MLISPSELWGGLLLLSGFEDNFKLRHGLLHVGFINPFDKHAITVQILLDEGFGGVPDLLGQVRIDGLGAPNLLNGIVVN